MFLKKMVAIKIIIGCLFFILFCFINLWRIIVNIKEFIYLRRKASTFECGYDLKNQSRKPFSLRFFLIVIVFLVFDIELSLLLKLPLKRFLLFMNERLLIIFIFIILLFGIVEEWRRGLLIWK